MVLDIHIAQVDGVLPAEEAAAHSAALSASITAVRLVRARTIRLASVLLPKVADAIVAGCGWDEEGM